mmetsp:Transcript_23575/g.67532  ORF Transcript_23575/g.67532 Transcript_23575/m.67532 type:complete len:418 (-) Transcript_23575:207-1460(-)
MPKKIVEEESLIGSEEDSTEAVFCEACGASLEGDHAFCPKCGAKRPSQSAVAKRLACGCCACCGCLGLTLIAVVFCLAFYLNDILKVGVHTVGSAFMGVDVSLDAVNIGLMSGRASITNLTVASPPGYNENLFELDRFVFDVAPASLMHGWASDFVKPIIIEDFTVYGCEVNLEAKMLSQENNALTVISHMDQTTKKISPEVEEEIKDEVEHPKLPDVQTSIKAMEMKIRVDRLSMQNISVSASFPPIPAVRYTLREVEVRDVGKKTDGVYMYEFIDIFVRALLMSVVKGAPAAVRVNLASAFGEDLWKNLDVSHILFDNGNGLEKLGEFAGWVSGEAALMPIKAAAMGAEIGAKAVGMGAKMNWEALKLGTKINSAVLNANTKAINEQVALGAKATETAAKLGLAFTNGMTKAFTR